MYIVYKVPKLCTKVTLKLPALLNYLTMMICMHRAG